MCNAARTFWPFAALFALALLLHGSAFAAAPAGQWWNASYAYRQQISIPAGASALPANYSVSVVFDHAAQVSGGRSIPSGNDVRVVHWNGAGWTELDRLADPDTPWDSATTRVWFRTAQAVNAGATDDDYYIYFNNPTAGAPPQSADNIFLLFDDFATGLSASRWNPSGSVSVNNGVVRVNHGASLTSDASFGLDTIWETRAELSDDYGAFEYWGASATVLFLNVYLRFEADGNSHQAVTNDLLVEDVRSFSPVDPREFQRYSFTREGENIARFLINGSQVAAFTSGEGPVSNLRVSVRNNENGDRMFYDWARVRPYRNPDPVLTLAAPEQPSATPIAHWRMEEPSWTGASGEVRDAGASGVHLTASGAITAIASPARAGDPGTCRYGVFDGVNDYLQVADRPALEPTARLSVAAWIYPRAAPASSSGLKTIVSKDAHYEFHLNGNRQINWWWGGAPRELTTSGPQIPLNQWTHVAITYESGAQRIYVNGVQRAASALTGALTANNLPFQIGQDQAIAERFWNGYIDEVALFDRALSAAEVSTLMNATYPCAAAAPKFVIDHDDYGVHCFAERIKVDVRDAANNPHTSYTHQVTLTTNANHGAWSLVEGGGVLNDGAANDGVATYQWIAGQASATFALNYPGGAGVSPVVDIDVYQTSDTSVRDDESEDDLTFAPSGFMVTSTVLPNPITGAPPPFVSPQTAGAEFPVHIAAYGMTPSDPECGIIESYTGAKSIKWWSEYANPASGVRQVTIDGAAIATSSTAASLASLTFVNGQASVRAKYKDVGAIAINLRDDSAGSGVISGGTGDIVVKPATFVLTNVRRTSDAAPNPGATAPNGTIFLTAGAPFSATVTARDAEGDATPSFGRESTPEQVALAPTVVAPASGVDSAIAARFNAFTNGVASRNDFSWSEVGAVSVRPHIADGDYLGAADVSGAAVVLGRFIPARFGVSANAPSFQTACPAGGFTYVGQPFNYAVAPVVTVTALSATGSLTQNYRDDFFKLTQASLAGRAHDTPSGAPALVSAAANLAIGAGQGVGTLTFSAGSGLSFARTARLSPFDAQVSLYVDVIDEDNVRYAGAGPTPARYTIGASGGIPFTSGGQQRYGRLAFRNAVGSELINLPTPLRTEYFVSDAAGFAANVADSCTSVAALSFPDARGHLATNETCVLGASPSCPASALQQFRNPAVSGDFNLILRAPGAGNDGSITIEADAPSWLEYDWNPANAGVEDPRGVAAFGVFQGVNRRIYQRERVR